MIWMRDYRVSKDLNMTKVTDPAENAAVTTEIIDEYDGVVITLTAAGNAQVLQDPTDVTEGKRFTAVNNDTSTHNANINGYVLEPGWAQIFIWDETAWCVYEVEGAKGATKTTKLAITGEIAAGTNFSVTSSGVNYTKSGDSGDLLASAALFEAAEYITVLLNGVYMIKGVQAVWQSQTAFRLNIIVDSGDEIIILS